jgi:hypothetical protein
VLFSREDVAQFVNRSFEPVWESVRPVPMVRIDFGNGNVLTRTLHGNIASYVCAADGQVLDVLPGIYTAPAYLDRLNQLRLLANFVDQLGKDKRDARLRQYHEGQIAALKKQEAVPQFVNAADESKLKVEGGVKAVLLPGNRVAQRPKVVKAPEGAKLDAEDVANWKSLAEDTETNETARRLQIHDQLVRSTSVRPEKLTKWLYKEVLHADLDDPYLGLGGVLFANYPFAGEDKKK